MALGRGACGCMAIDVVHILTRGGLRSTASARTDRRGLQRAARFVSIDLRFAIDTTASARRSNGPSRSREKYCSVVDSLRPGIELNDQHPPAGVGPARRSPRLTPTGAGRTRVLERPTAGVYRLDAGPQCALMIEAHKPSMRGRAGGPRTLLYKAAKLHRRPRGADLPFPGRRVGGDGRVLAARGSDRAAPPGRCRSAAGRFSGWRFLFRLYTWTLSPGARSRDLQADILNIMGRRSRAAAWVWAGLASPGPPLLSARTACHSRYAHAGHSGTRAWVAWLPTHRVVHPPVSELSVFTFFPWTGLCSRGPCREWLDSREPRPRSGA